MVRTSTTLAAFPELVEKRRQLEHSSNLDNFVLGMAGL